MSIKLRLITFIKETRWRRHNDSDRYWWSSALKANDNKLLGTIAAG